jgi:predicted AlkP superfamily pyrophosphatase or phosphodiesterase
MKEVPMRTIALWLSLLVGGCLRPVSSLSPTPVERPRLGVVIILDQLGSWVLTHHLPYLSPEGLLKKTMARGAYFSHVEYSYASTLTSPGHVAIFSGASPYQSKIVANRRWDDTRQKSITVFDDGASSFLGNTTSYASPSALQVETVADVLKRETKGVAKVVSLSMKERGAIIPGGQRPDLALWYDKTTGGFTTSTFYRDSLPLWLVQWQQQNPVAALFTSWEASDPERYMAELGADNAPGETNSAGVGNIFPHDPRRADNPREAILFMPQSVEWLLSLADESIEQLGLGEDQTTDLLVLSISGTDIVGHMFGPESWESVDFLYRVDLALGRWLSTVEAMSGPLSVLITADHGVAPLPEASKQHTHRAYRVEPANIKALAEAAIDQALGPGDWVSAFVAPYLYLSPSAHQKNVYQAALVAAAAIAAIPGIELAVPTEEAVIWRQDPSPTRQKIAKSLSLGAGGEVFVLPAMYSVIGDVETPGAGTGHGSYWSYDTQVPVLLSGPGIPHFQKDEVVSQTRVAATLSALLGVTPPASAIPEALPKSKPSYSK